MLSPRSLNANPTTLHYAQNGFLIRVTILMKHSKGKGQEGMRIARTVLADALILAAVYLLVWLGHVLLCNMHAGYVAVPVWPIQLLPSVPIAIAVVYAFMFGNKLYPTYERTVNGSNNSQVGTDGSGDGTAGLE